MLENKQLTIPEMIEKLKEIVPPENFQLQPKSAKDALLALEFAYQINTNDVLNNSDFVKQKLTEEVIDKWLDTYQTFILFKGNPNDLNSNLSNQELTKRIKMIFNQNND